ncbi:MAG: hypothetical protein ABSC05_19790 [Candidatus Solibacter sp.]|jgi:hypothetical protein
METDFKTRLLLACLAVLVRRTRTGVVIEDTDVEAALDHHEEVSWERDHRGKCVRLVVADFGK